MLEFWELIIYEYHQTELTMPNHYPTICHTFLSVASRGQKTAMRYKLRDTWQQLAWQDYATQVEELGCAFLQMGLKRGEKVAILSQTRFEWALLDLAILGAGGICVPIYPSNNAEEIEYILKDAEVKILILENQDQFKKWETIQDKCPNVAYQVALEPLAVASPAAMPNLLSFEDFKQRGQQFREEHPEAFPQSCATTQSTDFATIIYTSGTTGTPKGVVLDHAAIMSEITEVFPLVGINDQDTSLTFLPLAHVLGRVETWGSLVHGYTLAFAENVEKIRNNLLEVRPTFLIAVPRIFEKIYNGIRNQVDVDPTKKRIFEWSLKIGRAVGAYKMEHKRVPLTLQLKHQVASQLVFNNVHEKMGGRLRFAFSGGAPLAKEIGEFFHGVGILLLEGYGLTETTAAITANTPYSYCFGTVGKPFGDVEVQIASDGEILVKSAKVFREYYKKPKATREVLNDGWFATGDIGEFSNDGYLRITDRKKDLIKTSGGKYVAPQRLENILKLNKYVSNVLIHGDKRKYVVALITLDPEQLKQFAETKNLPVQDPNTLIQHPEIRELARSAVAEANAQLASFESIKNFAILPHDFTVESGELTPSLKVKRKVCDQKYHDIIEGLYGNDRSQM